MLKRPCASTNTWPRGVLYFQNVAFSLKCESIPFAGPLGTHMIPNPFGFQLHSCLYAFNVISSYFIVANIKVKKCWPDSVVGMFGPFAWSAASPSLRATTTFMCCALFCKPRNCIYNISVKNTHTQRDLPLARLFSMAQAHPRPAVAAHLHE